MENRHTRPKDPERVRSALIQEAAKIAVADGISAVTIQAVAAAAGVTKGGLTHHFPSKQALIDALYDMVVAAFDAALDARIAADPEPFGAFTRAYVDIAFDDRPMAGDETLTELAVAMVGDVELRTRWTRWLEDRVDRQGPDERDVRLTTARMAADGIWVNDMSLLSQAERDALRAHLVDLTRPASG